MPSESGSGRGEPGLVGVAKPMGSRWDGSDRAPQRDSCREEVAAGGGPSLHGDVFKTQEVKVWGRGGGPVCLLRRGPILRESVLLVERNPARVLGCGVPVQSGERAPTRKEMWAHDAAHVV
jgi:hypothetical protein